MWWIYDRTGLPRGPFFSKEEARRHLIEFFDRFTKAAVTLEKIPDGKFENPYSRTKA